MEKEFSYTLVTQKKHTPLDEVSFARCDKFEDLAEILKSLIGETPADVQKRDCNRFTPGIFTNNIRRVDNFKHIDFLVYDIDDIKDHASFLEAVANLETNTISFIMFGSPRNTEKTPKYRLILELEKRITDPQHYKMCYEETFNTLFPTQSPTTFLLDTNCKDAAHFFYIPNSSQIESFYSYGKGTPVPLIMPENTDKVIEEEKREAENLSRDAMFLAPLEQVTTNLLSLTGFLKEIESTLTPDYGTWLSVCFATVSLKNHFMAKEDCFKWFLEISNLDKGQQNHASKEECLAKFEECWENTQDKHTVGTIYRFALDAGWMFPKVYNSAIELVCANPEQTKFHLAYPNSESETIIPLYKTPFAPNIAAHTVTNSFPKKFQLKHEEVGYMDDKGVFKYLTHAQLVTTKNTQYPTNTTFMLGKERIGTYYDRETDELLFATHSIASANPTFSQLIHEFLEQLNIDLDWLYSYLVYITDCTKALPWLYLYGESGTGKSFLALLIGSLFTSEPDKTFFQKNASNFKQTAGKSPIIFMEEHIPNDATTLKELVTSNSYTVDQKFKGVQTVRGYHRLVSAANKTSIDLPQDDRTDFSAFIRRVQPVLFTKENKTHLNTIGGINVTKKWLEYEFKKHIAWIRENKHFFKMVTPSTDIIALPPTGLNDDTAAIYGASEENKAILEYVVGYAIKTTRASNKSSYLAIPNIQKGLVDDRVTQKRISENELRHVLGVALGITKMKRRVNTQGIANWEIPFSNIIELSDKLGLN